MTYDPGFDPVKFKAGMDADHYNVLVHRHAAGQIGVHNKIHLFSARQDYSFVGVLHECPLPPADAVEKPADGMISISRSEGERSRDPNLHEHDAEMLETALLTEQDSFLQSRYLFHLGNACLGCKKLDKALAAYLHRAALGFLDDEVVKSLLQAAGCMESLGYPFDIVLGAYCRAICYDHRSAEAAWAAARYCRGHERFIEGYKIAKGALPLCDQPLPDAMYSMPFIYRYALLDEFAACAFNCGHIDECVEAYMRILARPDLPVEVRRRVSANMAAVRKQMDIVTPPMAWEGVQSKWQTSHNGTWKSSPSRRGDRWARRSWRSGRNSTSNTSAVSYARYRWC